MVLQKCFLEICYEIINLVDSSRALLVPQFSPEFFVRENLFVLFIDSLLDREKIPCVDWIVSISVLEVYFVDSVLIPKNCNQQVCRFVPFRPASLRHIFVRIIDVRSFTE